VVRRIVCLAVVAFAFAGFALVSSPASAVNGCIPSNPANPQYTSACSFTITSGGDYNASSAGASYTVTIKDAAGVLVRSVSGGPGRTTIIAAAEATTLAGGTAAISVTSPGAVVFGCAACAGPPVVPPVP
jgi:hypothetical protein